MKSVELFQHALRTLNEQNIDYLVVGSFASNLYGIPRSTEDADFVLRCEAEEIDRLIAALNPPFVLDPQLAFEPVTGNVRHLFTQPHTPFKIEFFDLGDDPHALERFSRRLKQNFGGLSAYVPTPEDVIVTKLRWYKQLRRSKDGEDIKDVLNVQGDHLDFDYIHSWCQRHGTRALLDEVRARPFE